MVTLDARLPGVDVPARFRDDGRLRLNLSHRFGLAMELNDWGIHATLTFGGVPHSCKLPWNSIYQVMSHATSEQFVFPADVPDDLLPDEGTAREEAPRGKGKARLTLVSESEPQDAGQGAGKAGEPPPPPPADGGGRGHLRRIK